MKNHNEEGRSVLLASNKRGKVEIKNGTFIHKDKWYKKVISG